MDVQLVPVEMIFCAVHLVQNMVFNWLLFSSPGRQIYTSNYTDEKKVKKKVSSPAPFLDPLSMMAAAAEAEEDDDSDSAKNDDWKRMEERRSSSEAEELWRTVKAEMAAAATSANSGNADPAPIRIREEFQSYGHLRSIRPKFHSVRAVHLRCAHSLSIRPT